MTNEEKQNLYAQVDGLLKIFGDNHPIRKDGSFDSEIVKKVTMEMMDAVISNQESCQRLKDWMETKEYWTSPASARYHGNVKGGLAAHSLMVAYQALVYTKAFTENFANSKRSEQYSYTAEDIFISAIAHDLCKAGTYSIESRKTKDFNGNWKYEPYYKVKSDLRNLGHGNESVLLLLESMPEMIQKRTVIEAISRHMGFSDLSDNERINYSSFLQNPLVLLLQLADQTAAQWWDI